MGAVDCCTNENRMSDPHTQKESKQKKLNNHVHDNLQDNDPLRLEEKDIGNYNINKEIDHAFNNKEYDLEDLFKGLDIDKETLKKQDAYFYANDCKFNDNLVYKGSFVSEDDKTRHGFGAVLIDDDFYIGQISGNEANGAGLLFRKGFGWLKGNFIERRLDGIGTISSFDDYKYVGCVLNGQKSGKGEEVYSAGGSYKGEFCEDQKSGYGEYFFPDGGHYKGNFSESKLDGYGLFNWKDGKTYDGYWKQDQMETPEGKVSTFIWPDAKKYVGEYKNNKKEGKGRFTYPNGVVYDGDWYDGKQHGEGIFISY